MDSIVFICTGNTCRSPMAEGFFRALGGTEKLGLTAKSAGMFTRDGLFATPYAVEAAGELGADLSGHLSQMLTPELAKAARYLVCMTGAHYDHLLAQYPEFEDKIFLLGDEDVADPFGGTLATYRKAAEEIHRCVAALIARLGKNA